MSFYSELKRRNVFKVAIVYLAVAWLLLQVSDTLGPALRLPEWFISAVAFLLILGFPVALVFAWAFELTPEGLKRDSADDSTEAAAASGDSRLNLVVIFALVVAVGYYAVDRFVLGTGADATSKPDTVQEAAEAPAESENSIAVLPFVNMSSDEEQEYFSDGLSEELLNLLASIPELNVAARTSSFSFKDKDVDVKEIAAQLNVAHVLEGSVRKHDDQLRITVQLVHADDGYRVWSETYDRQLDNVFEIQEDIASSVVDALRITLLGDAPEVRKTDPAAYQLYLEGQFLKRQLATDSLNRAVKVFKQAVAIDPTYVPALAELADTYLWSGGSDEAGYDERKSSADQAIEKAISIDPDYAFSYYVRGISSIFTHQDFAGGIKDFDYALQLDPDNAFLVAAIGKGALLTGQYDLGITQYQAALAMEPLVPEFYYFMGRAMLASGRLDEAEAAFRTLVSMTPFFYGGYFLWESLLAKGDLDAALAAAGSDNVMLAMTHYELGNTAQADEHLAAAKEVARAYTVAKIYAYRGDADSTFEWLERSETEDEYPPTFILTEPGFQSVYADERWAEFLGRNGLGEFWKQLASQAGDS